MSQTVVDQARKRPEIKIEGKFNLPSPSKKELTWRVFGNEAFFFIGQKPLSWDDIWNVYGEEYATNLAGRILAATRQFGNDTHTSHISTTLAVYSLNGAKRVFWGATVSSSDAFERLCAERNAMNQAQQAKLKDNTKPSLEQMFMMSGKKDGDCKSSCMYCRQEAFLAAADPKRSNFFFVPVFTPDSDIKLKISAATNIDDVDGKAGEVYKRSFEQMYPLSKVDMPRQTQSGIRTETILRSGLNWVEKTGEFYKPKITPHLTKLIISAISEQKNQDVVLGEEIRTSPTKEIVHINRKLLNVIKSAKEGHDGTEISRIRAVIVKTEDGKFYVGHEVVGPKLTTKTTASVNALMNASNKKITAVYSMTYEPEFTLKFVELAEREHESHNPSGHNVAIRMNMPDGRERERLYKNIANPRDLDSLKIVEIPINDGSLTAAELSSIAWQGTMKDLNPDAFAFPKSR